LGQLAAGRSTEQVIEDYAHLERDDVLAAFEYAADTRERENPLTAAGCSCWWTRTSRPGHAAITATAIFGDR
jgi:hypothetical protein